MPMSPALIPQAQATATEVIWLALLTFSMPGAPSLRVVNNTENIMSRGNEFKAFPFQVTMPNDDEDRLPQVTLRIANVSGEIIEWIRAFPVAPSLLLEIVTNLDFDVVEKSVGFLKLKNVSYDAIEVSGSLEIDSFLTRKFGDIYDPVQFPALFSV